MSKSCEIPEVVARGGAEGMVPDKVGNGFRGLAVLIGDTGGVPVLKKF